MSKVLYFIFFISIPLILSADTLSLSHEAGFYESSFYLNAELGDKVLLYSYDNSFNNRTDEFPDSIHIEQNRTISFALKENGEITPLGSYSYFISFDTEFKVVSISIDDRYLYDPHQGIYVAGTNSYYDRSDTIDGEFVKNANFTKSWERNNYVEIFDEDSQRIIAQNSGLRIFGGMTRYLPEKSLRIIAREEYGDSRFTADIFNNGFDEYKHLILRTSGNDYRKTRFRDAFATSIAADANLDVQASSPAHLFVNSEYWGVYNIREKINAHYFKLHYDIPKSSIDIIQGNRRVDHGDRREYRELLSYVSQNDLTSTEHYSFVSSKMDVENFANFWIHQIFFANSDARGNIRCWRSDSLDGKFRWVVYDVDLGFLNGKATRNYLRDFTSPVETNWYNPTWSTFLLRNLLKNEDFKEYFINQSIYLFNSTLSEDDLLERLNRFETMYAPEMAFHFENRRSFSSYNESYSRWLQEVETISSFISQRTDYSFVHLENKFDLEDPYSIDISINDTTRGHIEVNGNVFPYNNYSGRHYESNRISFQVVANMGYTKTITSRKVLRDDGTTDSLIAVVIFEPLTESMSKVIINEIDLNNNAIEIFNQTDSAINISGWRISNNDTITELGSLIIEANGFLVFSSKLAYVRDSRTNVHNLHIDMNNREEIIQLFDKNDCKVDSVSWSVSDSTTPVFSRTVPYDKLFNLNYSWVASDEHSLGRHNNPYLNILEKTKKQKVTLISFIVVLCSVIIVKQIVIFRLKDSDLP